MRLQVVSKSGRLRICEMEFSRFFNWFSYVCTSPRAWQIPFTHSVICASVGSLVRKSAKSVTWVKGSYKGVFNRIPTMSWQMSHSRSFSWGRSPTAEIATTNVARTTKTWKHHGGREIHNLPSSSYSWKRDVSIPGYSILISGAMFRHHSRFRKRQRRQLYNG